LHYHSLNQKDMDYLQIATEKYLTNNILPEHVWDISLDEFIMANFSHCDPNSRGTKFVKKLVKDSGGKIKKIGNQFKRGDVKIGNTYSEVKHPYLCRESKSFRITNIRPWQDFATFIICLVDCEDKFRSHFFVIRKNDLLTHPLVRLDDQHSDKESAKENAKSNVKSNKVIAMGRTDMLHVLNSVTLLRGTTYEDFVDYVKYIGIDTLDERIEFQFKPKRTYKKRQVNIKEQLDLTY
jgi:hypothetical protein